MEAINNYYNYRKMKFGMSGDRRDKILPLLMGYTGTRILDVGCASGYLGGFLKKRGNWVEGWDLSKKSVLEAGEILDRALVVDLQSLKWPSNRKKFDLIICSEVLEHLFDPEAVLDKLKSYLKPGGQMLLTTPNILHLYLRLKFLGGEFNYEEEGVMSRSHLHFFTHDSFLTMLRGLNFTVVKENNVIFPRTLAFIWKNWPNLFAYQTVLLVKVH